MQGDTEIDQNLKDEMARDFVPAYVARKWLRPKWLRHWEHLIVNTGGNSIDDLMNSRVEADRFSYSVMHDLRICVESQLELLRRLREEGLLRKKPPAAA